MRWLVRFTLTLVLIAGLPGAGQEPPSAPELIASPAQIRAIVQEVLLDVVVRDRQGRPVTDLKTNELEVYEDGILQKPTSFRLVRGEEVTTTAATAVSAGGAQGTPQAAPPATDPLRQTHRVTLVFTRLSGEGRQLARQAALELIKEPLPRHVSIAVFAIDLRLRILQQFTQDRDLLRAAIDRATTQAYSSPSGENLAQARFPPSDSGATGAGPSQPQLPAQALSAPGGGTGVTEEPRSTIGSDDLAASMGFRQASRAAINALLSLTAQERALPGRKTVLYFSEALDITPDMRESFQTLLSEANRGNVSFYALDTRGLMTTSPLQATRTGMAAAARASREQQISGGVGAVTPAQAKAFDTAEASVHADVRANMEDLATSTGGFLVADTNDLRAPVHRIVEDALTYYEVAYRPQWTEYDGRFHRISVKVLRPNVKVQARSGYFAVPPSDGTPVYPYEIPLLAALNSGALPHAFDSRAAAMHFTPQAGGVQCAVVVEAPLRNFTFTPNEVLNTSGTHISALVLLKNSAGQVLQKFSQDVPLRIPQDKALGFQKGMFIFTRSFVLLPGKYTLASALMDHSTAKISASRLEFTVPEVRPGVFVSSVSLVRSFETQTLADEDPDSAFRFQGGKIIPTLGEPIKHEPGAQVSLYFVVYAPKEVPEKPQLKLEFFRGGTRAGETTLELGAADENGRLPYVASLPADSFEPGQYEAKVVVRQGASTAEEAVPFTIIP